MDIRNWPLDRIMQLPDHCFGRRWPVGLGFTLATGAAEYDMAEGALPDRMVVWGVNITAEGSPTATNHIELAMGDRAPKTEAEVELLEKIFTGIKASDGDFGQFEATPAGGSMLTNLRMPVASQGRRLVGQCKRHVGASVAATIIIIISSIPNEVPDCLFSDHR